MEKRWGCITNKFGNSVEDVCKCRSNFRELSWYL